MSADALTISGWRQANFGTTVDSGIAANQADPDFDGLSNLIEFAFGLNPKSGPNSKLPSGVISNGNFVIDFAQPDNVSGVTYGAEWSPNLDPTSWTALPDSGINGHHHFSLSTAGHQKLFFRLTILINTDSQTFYLDSVNGSDSNNGLSSTSAFATPSALTASGVSPGEIVWVATGSTFFQELTLTGDDITVSSYGTGPRPIFDCRDIASGWTKTQGSSFVYQCPITLPGNTKIKGNAWEDASMLIQVSSLALCDSTPGSCYVADWSAPATTLYIHPDGNTNPSSNSRTYRYSRREHGVEIGGNRGRIIGIQAIGNAHQDGSLKIAGGINPYFENIRAEDGSRHSAYGAAGSTLVDCYFYRGRNDLESPGEGNGFVCYQDDITATSYSTLRCTFDGGSTPKFQGANNHGSQATQTFDAITHTQPTFIKCTTGFAANAKNQVCDQATFVDCETAFFGGSAGNVITVKNTVPGSTLNQLYNSGGQIQINSVNNQITVPLLGSAVPGFYRIDVSSADSSLTVTGDILTILEGNMTAGLSRIIHHQRGPIVINNSEFHPALANPINDVLVAGFSGGVSSYTGGGNKFPRGARFTLNGTTYLTLKAWQAAGHDLTSSYLPMPASTAEDNFNRSNGTLDSSLGWVRLGGAANQASVVGNSVAVTGTTKTLYRRTALASPDGWVSFRVAGVPATAGPLVVVRAQDASNWIGIRWNQTSYYVYKSIGGVVSQIGAWNMVTPVVGQEVILTVKGDRVWLVADDVQLVSNSAMSATAIGGNTGAGILAWGIVNPFIDDFKAGGL
jgi:hypothetical protein